ncbi:MAG TPA: aldehyde ferredoxin oxidoreductase family protein [Candidatus Deferrimicrobiaceae bacterium]|nr:aldehyde ferredoxin oxidoreductase family protein [Candidatus Deferrimicrobiaceae bacterium]
MALTATVYHVDLTRGTIETRTLPEDVYRKYPGGSALAAYLLLQAIPAGADPLGPDNVLVMAVSPLTGLAISGQSRMTACARSPLTGAIGDSQCGGFFPAEMRAAGADAFVFTGRSPEPVYLWLHEGRAALRPAGHLWGKVTADVDRLLKEEVGDPKAEVAQIGPAGENLVRFAAIMNMVNRANGRTGLGAVMGSKRLKAVVVRGSKSPKPAMAAEFRGLVKRLKAMQEVNPGIGWFGEYGTAGVLAIQDKMGGQPTRNYTEGTFDRCRDIDGSTMVKTILKERDTCYACVVKCKRVVEVVEPDVPVDPIYGGPEYETLTFFGSMCGVGDLKLLARASADANMYGMDTISCGATIAWAMEARAKGLLDDQGLGLEWGDGRAVLRAIEAIALRRGAGDLLAEGSLRAAQRLGPAAVDLTVTVKGQELPAHMPQHKRSLGLIYAVNPFGADHQSSEHDSMLKTKPGGLHHRRLSELGDFGNLDLRDLSDAKVRFAYVTQCFYSALDTLGLCQFVWGPSWQLYGPAETVELVRYGTGWDATMPELLQIGERRIQLMRAFNAREQIGKSADALPKKLFEPLGGKGPTAGVALTTEEFERARETYYALAGCDPATGYPTRSRLADLGLEWVTETLPGAR